MEEQGGKKSFKGVRLPGMRDSTSSSIISASAKEIPAENYIKHGDPQNSSMIRLPGMVDSTPSSVVSAGGNNEAEPQPADFAAANDGVNESSPQEVQTKLNRPLLTRAKGSSYMSPEKQRFFDRVRDFYLIHEPEKVEFIMPIVEWGMQVGVEKLNDALVRTYGEGLKERSRDEMEDDFSGLTNRIKLFYQIYDPSHVSGAETIIAWACKVGEEKLNQTLRETYKKDLTDVDAYPLRIRKFYTLYEPSKVSAIMPVIEWAMKVGEKELNKALMKNYSKTLDAVVAHENLVMAPDAETLRIQAEEKRKADFKRKLENFYRKHEPSKLAHIHPVVDYANRVGQLELDSKLYRIYGEGLDDIEENKENFDHPPGFLELPSQSPSEIPYRVNVVPKEFSVSFDKHELFETELLSMILNLPKPTPDAIPTLVQKLLDESKARKAHAASQIKELI